MAFLKIFSLYCVSDEFDFPVSDLQHANISLYLRVKLNELAHTTSFKLNFFVVIENKRL